MDFFLHFQGGFLASFQVSSIVEGFFFFLDDSFLFQHDNDQVHRIYRTWIVKISKGKLDWPGSRDLNPINHTLDELELKMAR